MGEKFAFLLLTSIYTCNCKQSNKIEVKKNKPMSSFKVVSCFYILCSVAIKRTGMMKYQNPALTFLIFICINCQPLQLYGPSNEKLLSERED